MTGTDSPLAEPLVDTLVDTESLDAKMQQRIDEVLRIRSFDGSRPDTVQALTLLASATNEYLRQAVPANMRTLAAGIAATLAAGPPGSGEEIGFRSALENLHKSLDDQKRVETMTSQFADDPEMVQEFLVEAREHLSNVEAGVLLLEREPEDGEALNSVFRSFHTIKGLAAFLGAAAIQELAHETENVLDLARSGAIVLSPELIDLILRSADELAKCLNIAAAGKLSEIPRCDQGLLQSLAAAAIDSDPVQGAEAEAEAEAKDHEPADREPGDRKAAKPQAEAKTVAAPAPAASGDGAKAAGSSGPSRPQENQLRVDTAKLEYLIDMVGELVIAESVVRHDPAVAQSQDPVLSRNLKQLARVVQEVQKTSMSMRMVSVGSLFRKMNRLIRDLSRKSGKMVELITVGDDVELDRGIVEALADPMVHMIRNAVDHGLEMPEERRLAGKSEQGTVRLKAMHDAGDIVIELADDGRGLDTAKILAKAKRLGLVGEQEQPDEESIFKLIFEPGFSTADKVSDLSGRGVGMDVVKKQIQKLRGRIAIRSIPGRGCTFVLRLPLTLAIIDGLVVGVGGQRYILPMFAVREMFSPGPDTFVTLENRAEAALFRDKLLPVIRLSRLLETRAADRNSGVLIVAEGRDQLYCVAVDQLIGKQEVVIKSLGSTYRDIPAISGGSILGDGRVGLIIDVNSLRYQD